MEKREDAYIKLLRMARNEMNGEGVSYADFITRVKKLGIKQDAQKLFHTIYGHEEEVPKLNLTYHMSFDAYMSLIEYEELAHSLEESKQARKEAQVATWIAAIAIVLQVVFGVIEMI